MGEVGASSVRAQELLRAGWGLALLLAPDTVVSRLGAASPDRTTRLVARVLGGRHLAQALATLARPTRPVLRWGGFADVAHAGTGLMLAATDARYRRAALVDAMVATALGARSVRSGDQLHQPASAIRERIS
jgi:hypothetical protein